MRPEARPIEFTNGHAHFYGKKKVDKVGQFQLCKDSLAHLTHSL